jgi:hypothetical protein
MAMNQSISTRTVDWPAAQAAARASAQAAIGLA